MKFNIQKILPWILAISIIGTTLYTYAQNNTSHEERIKFLSSRIEKNEKKQDRENDKINKKQDQQYKELTDLFREMDRKLTRALTLLGDKK